MELPPLTMHGTKYSRYKEKQNDLAIFLGITGRLCNAPPHLTEPDDGQQHNPTEAEPDDGQQKKPTEAGQDQPGSAAPKGRLKGKARKLAKEKAKVEAQARPKKEVKKETKKYTLRLNNYVPLAKHIAASKSVHATIPIWVLSTLSNIIRDRRELMGYWQGVERNTDASLEKQNLQHQNHNHLHMVELLLEVKEILQGKYKDQLQKATEATKAENIRPGLPSDPGHTRFPQEFNLDDTDEETEEQADESNDEKQQEEDRSAWKAQAITTADVSFEAEVDVSFADAVQALYDLCQQWQDARNVVSNAWEAYSKGEMDIGAASLTANTAIDVARRQEQEVRPLIARHDEVFRKTAWKGKLKGPIGSWTNIYSATYEVLFGRALFDFRETTGTITPVPRQEHEAAMLLDHFFIAAFQRLETIHSVSSHSEHGDLSMESRGFQMPYGQTRAKNGNLIELDWAEMMFFGVHSKELNLYFVDEVSRAMVASTYEPHFGLWTAFAWQLFADARVLLGPKSVSRPFDELQTYLKAAGGVLTEVINVGAEELHSSDFPKVACDLAVDALHRINAMRVDWVQCYGQKYGYLSNKVEGVSSDEPFRLWRCHPIFCGAALQSARLLMAGVGNMLEQTGARAIIRVAHLQNACGVYMRDKGEEDLEGLKWEDMERLVVSLQPDNVFIGGQRPTTRSDCAKNYALVEGTPLDIAGGGRPNSRTVRETMRDMRRRQRKTGTAFRKTINAKDGDTFPISFQFKGRLLDGDGRRDFTVGDLSLILERSRNQAPKHRGAQRQHRPSELLADLLIGLNKEAPVLTWSYVRLYMDSVRVLRDIDAKLESNVEMKKIHQVIGGDLAREDERQPAGWRVALMLAGSCECVDVATGALVQWLKANGGDGAVRFPAPPSKGPSSAS